MQAARQTNIKYKYHCTCTDLHNQKFRIHLSQSVPREGMPPASANHEVKDVTILLMYNMSLGFGLLTFTLSHGQSYPSLSLMEMKRWWTDFSFAIYSYFFEIQYHVRMSFCNFSPTCLVGQSTSSLAFQNNESSVAFQN